MIADYFRRLTQAFGDGWTRFWFTPSDPATVSLIRLLTGAMVVYLHATLSLDLVRFFGAGGLLPAADIAPLEGNTFSYLNHLTSPLELWTVHLLGLAVLLAFTAGLWTRATSILSLVVFLSTVHRAPMIAGRTESVLSMLLLYLCIAPCGRRFSLDARISKKTGTLLGPQSALSTTATIATRLIQVHLALIVAMMGLSQLGGDAWWSGLGIWWLITRQESRLVDFTWMETSPKLIDAWGHVVVAFELAFGILIWSPLARPLLLAAGLLVWTSLALVTGDLTFSLALVVASLAFVSPEWVGRLLDRPRSETVSRA